MQTNGAVGISWGLVLACAAASCTPSAEPAVRRVGEPEKATDAGATLALGERITEPLVALADIASSPSQFQNRVVATRGKVTAVCQEMGCWMQLEDASGKAHVRMHGHSFFVPKTASGHLARVQARVLPNAKSATDCEESQTGSTARVELDATGVELD